MPELAPVVRETRSFVIGASFQCHQTLLPDYRGARRKVAARDPDHVRPNGSVTLIRLVVAIERS